MKRFSNATSISDCRKPILLIDRSPSVFGCFLELASIAAAQRGLRMETVLFPNGELSPRLTSDPVAHVRFVADAGISPDPLFTAIPSAANGKGAF